MTPQLLEQLGMGPPTFSAEALRGLAPEKFCRALLPHVSRTFAISVPCLPPPLDLQVTVAYLLCRLADTVEDSTHWTPQVRQQAFCDLIAVLEADDVVESARHFQARHGGFAGEQACDLLFRSASCIFEVLSTFPQPVVAATRKCVCEMIRGMRQTPVARRGQGVSRLFENVEQMERYCHYVAGVVGIMLTELFDIHLPDATGFATPARLEQGRRFGLGLQMTNILVDRVDDARAGKSYIPTLSSMAPEARVPSLIERADSHLSEALEYTLALPLEPPGMRMFCLFPLFFALRTLSLVRRKEAGLLESQRPKISRTDVMEIAGKVHTRLTDAEALRAWHRREREPLESR